MLCSRRWRTACVVASRLRVTGSSCGCIDTGNWRRTLSWTIGYRTLFIGSRTIVNCRGCCASYSERFACLLACLCLFVRTKRNRTACSPPLNVFTCGGESTGQNVCCVLWSDRVGLGRLGSGGFPTLTGRFRSPSPDPAQPDPRGADPRGLMRPVNSPGVLLTNWRLICFTVLDL